jgi:hypothetical protein
VYGPQRKAPTESLVCGHEIPAQSVGRQGANVECRNEAFELMPGPINPQTKQSQFTTHCVSCHARDPMSVIFTGVGSQFSLGPGGHLTCPCAGVRFRLSDKGNEVFATCVHCDKRSQLGYTAGAMAT